MGRFSCTHCNMSYELSTVTSMRLINYNKRFLHLAASSPCNTYDACLLRRTSLFKEIANGEGIPNKSTSLGELGLIPLVTVSDSAFSRSQLLI